MYQDKLACEQARLHLEESRGSSTRKETRVRVVLRLALLAVTHCKWRACSRAKSKCKCLQSILEMIFYIELHVRLYFDCTSAIVLELNLTLEPNSV